MDSYQRSTSSLVDAARAIWDANAHLELTHADFGAFAQAYCQTVRGTTTELEEKDKTFQAESDTRRAVALSRLDMIRNPHTSGNRADTVDRNGSRLILWIYGGIGGEGLLAEDICKALDEHRDALSVVLRIASAGGWVDETLRIAEALMTHPGKSLAIIDRFAYSGASAIASAANRVLIRRNASWMAHQAWTVFGGDADQFVQYASHLRGSDQRIAGLYSRRRKISPLNAYGLIKSGRYLNPEEAVSAGVCDAVIHALPIDWDKPNENNHES